MLRPATPLSLVFFVAFVLLLLSTLSTPVIKAIPIGAEQGYSLGVLGYCKTDGSACVGPTLGYSTDGLFSDNPAGSVALSPPTRHSLTYILIVHPIACFLTLVCFGLAIAAHFHSPAHSPRFLLALLILTIPTLLVTLLAFLVDILLFIPHVGWGGWIVLAATILIVASSVLTCAMRRTLVSRKARKKRIAENAEMSGANYYDNLNQNRFMAATNEPSLPRADSPPPMSGSTAVDKGMPAFAAFEMKRQEANTPSRDGEGGLGGLDDRTPLNPNRDPSIRSASTGGRRAYRNGANEPPMPMDGRPSIDSNGRPPRPSRDQYGNPLPAAVAMGAMGDLPPPGLRHQGSQGSLGSNGSHGSRSRGRGGFGPSARGYSQPRGAYGPPRGAYGGRGGRGPPPPGWNGRGRGGYGPAAGALGMRGPGPSRPPPPGYMGDSYASSGPVMRSSPPPNVERGPDAFIARPDVPIGQAIEMDERTGSPPGGAAMNPSHMNPTYGLRDGDADVDGMVGLQQDRKGSLMQRDVNQDGSMRSPTSVYSDQHYVPPRQQWAESGPHRQGTLPLATDTSASNLLSSTALPVSPLEPMSTSYQRPPQHHRAASEPYYEDVDPRFAVEEPSQPGAHTDEYMHEDVLPSALTPGGMTPGAIISGMPGGYPTPGAARSYGGLHRMQSPVPHNPDYLHPNSYAGGAGGRSGGDGGAVGTNEVLHSDEPSLSGNAAISHPSQQGYLPSNHSSYDNLVEGTRSPAEGSERASEASYFTSISQRPVNPNWRPAGGPSSAYGGASSASAVQRRREDIILNGNPDFSLPGVRGGRGGRGRGRGTMAASNPAAGLTPSGRYPTDI